MHAYTGPQTLAPPSIAPFGTNNGHGENGYSGRLLDATPIHRGEGGHNYVEGGTYGEDYRPEVRITLINKDWQVLHVGMARFILEWSYNKL